MLANIYLPRPGIAEDAPVLIEQRESLYAIGVFDGLGGAGAFSVDGEDGNRPSAYYASRTAKAAVAEAFLSMDEQSDIAEKLAVSIGAALAKRNMKHPVDMGIVRSSLLRSYPTTAAVLVFQVSDGQVSGSAIWAGDSRCYALAPDAGLQQLTQDDSRVPRDPLHAIRENSPMSNTLSADGRCKMRASRTDLQHPVVLFSATDGSFDCLPSPMHFERLLLEALAESKDVAGWETELLSRFQSIADDDVSLGAAFIGWQSIAEAASDFAPRLKKLQEMLEPIDQAIHRHGDNFHKSLESRIEADRILEAVWEEYSIGYMARLRHLGETG